MAEITDWSKSHFAWIFTLKEKVAEIDTFGY